MSAPSSPEGGLQFLATETAIRIAAEGRKFGLYLLALDAAAAEGAREHRLAVRQPAPDADELGRRRRPPDRASSRSCRRACSPRATGFRQGEALVAGKVVPTPTFVRFGARVSEEGGSDVPTDWARSRRRIDR